MTSCLGMACWPGSPSAPVWRRSRTVTVDDVRPLAVQALADVFSLDFEEIPADDGHGLWPQPVHASLART